MNQKFLVAILIACFAFTCSFVACKNDSQSTDNGNPSVIETTNDEENDNDNGQDEVTDIDQTDDGQIDGDNTQDSNSEEEAPSSGGSFPGLIDGGSFDW